MRMQDSLQILISLALLTTSMQGVAAEQGLNAIYQRESAVNQVSSALFRLKNERQTITDDTKGLPADVTAYAQAAGTWLNGYQTLVRTLKATTGLDEMQTLVHSTLRDLANQRSSLRRMEQDILERIRSTSGQLNLNSNLPATDELKGVANEVQQETAKLQKLLENFSSSVALASDEISRVTQAFNADFFMLRYQSLAVKQGLEREGPKVQAFRDFIVAEIFAGKIYEFLDNLTMEASSVMLALEAQKLKTLMHRIDQNCREIKMEIASTSLTRSQKDRLHLEVTQQCNTIQDDYQNTIQIYSSQVLAQSMQSKKLKKHRNICNVEGKACDQYNRLKKISSEAIAGYSEEAIAYLEQQWQVLEKLKKDSN